MHAVSPLFVNVGQWQPMRRIEAPQGKQPQLEVLMELGACGQKLGVGQER
jgi:hypothetical protein